MRIMAIDDEAPALAYLSACLEPMGHTVQAFEDPGAALAKLDPEVDLVITDISMPGADGFAVAEAVAERLGKSPPRTLLVSGKAYREKMDTAKPSSVLGLLAKPYLASELGRVLRFIGLTRRRCPGRLAPLCPHTPGGAVGREAPHPLCDSAGYSECPHYNACCGKRMQDWVAMTAGGAAWNRG